MHDSHRMVCTHASASGCYSVQRHHARARSSPTAPLMISRLIVFVRTLPKTLQLACWYSKAGAAAFCATLSCTPAPPDTRDLGSYVVRIYSDTYRPSVDTRVYTWEESCIRARLISSAPQCSPLHGAFAHALPVIVHHGVRRPTWCTELFKA